ncbi:MAG: hypothetical protein ACM3JQ_05910 [Candidatus Eiseniibacteriota bacterium]
MSNDDLEYLKQNQRDVEERLAEYLEANRLNMDDFLKRTSEQYRTYIIGQIELLQSQIKSAIQTSNDMMVALISR